MGPWSKADLERWASEHGGIVRSEGPDANGTVTHHTADGTYVTMVGDLPRMIGHAAPQAGRQEQASDPAAAVAAAGGPVMLKHRVTGETRIMTRAAWEREKQSGSAWFGPTAQWEEVPQAAPAAAQPPAQQQAAPSSGGNMDQAALEARIAELQKQYPGLKFMGQSIKDKTVRRIDPDSEQPVTETVRVPVVQWIDPVTGYTLTAEVEPGGGRYTVTDDRLIEGNKTDAKSGGFKEGDVRGGGANSKKRERFTNGQWVVEDNPLYEPPESNTKPQNVPTNTTEPFIVERNPDNTITTRPNPNYKPPTPTTKQETIRGSDGKDYTRVSIIDPTTNAVTIKNFGPDGKQVSEIPGEGPSRPTTPGPPLPQIVLGASQDAARTYKEQLQEGVAAGRWSQAWADSRWKEFMEVANLAVAEAATRQRNEESQRNAEFNIANARMGSMNTATSNALTFVNSINGLLPAGSNLGGQAFAALLGLNMLQTQMSGMNKIDPRRQPPQLTPAEISNPAALQARREQVQTQVQQAAAPPVRDDYRTNPGQPAAPAPATAPAPVAPAPPISQQARDGYQNEGRGVDAIPPGVTPVPGTGQVPGEAGNDPFVGGRVLPQPGAESDAGPDPMEQAPPPAPYEETVTVRHRGLRGTRTVTRAYWEQYKAQHPWLSQMWVEGPAEPGAPPAPTTLDPTVPYPSNIDPNSEGVQQPVPEIRDPIDPTPPAVQKVMPNPAGEWAALAPLAPTPMQQPAMAGAAQMGEPLAARRARIASSPPWRLSEDDLMWAEQNGFGQEAWGVPGRVA